MPRTIARSVTHVSTDEPGLNAAALDAIRRVLTARQHRLASQAVEKFLTQINGNVVAWYRLDPGMSTGRERKAWTTKAEKALVRVRGALEALRADLAEADSRGTACGDVPGFVDRVS